MNARSQNNTGAARAGRLAFTLIEMVVAVGAVALVAVGLAAIFDSIGKTVSGGKRVSVLNQYAALIESRMRRDFDAMARDGAMIIRQQWCDVHGPGQLVDDPPGPDGLFDPNQPLDRQPDAVRLYADDTNPRARRIDEIMFFARGQFTSSRPPLVPGYTARSEVARIYYGHGQRRKAPLERPQDPADRDARLYYTPRIDDSNASADPEGDAMDWRLGFPTEGNPNRYAGDWTLLRLETLLARPGVAPEPTITGAVLGQVRSSQTSNALSNRVGQMGLQPAAASIFRSFNRTFPTTPLNWSTQSPPPPADCLYVNSATHESDGRARFSSGLVDVACTDLDELRMYSTRLTVFPEYPSPNAPNSNLAAKLAQQYSTTPAIASPRRPSPPQAGQPGEAVDRVEAWMEDMMPTYSVGHFEDADDLFEYRTQGFPVSDGYDPEQGGVRVRYEPQSTDLLGVLDPQQQSARRDAAETVSRRADQLMLASSVFLPHCSEFIVEWSFGLTNPNTDALIWYGLPRGVNAAGEPRVDPTNPADKVVAYPYPFFDATSPTTFLSIPYPLAQGGKSDHLVTDRLIYGRTPPNGAACMTSYFGLNDPTFPTPAATSAPAIESMPWAWPRLVRVTITLSDAQDPSIESTFQFVFRVPDRQGQTN